MIICFIIFTNITKVSIKFWSKVSFMPYLSEKQMKDGEWDARKEKVIKRVMARNLETQTPSGMWD